MYSESVQHENMSKNKNASDRYLILDGLLSRKFRKFTASELLEKVNEGLISRGLEPIGRTQLYSDLKYLEFSDYASPIIRENNGLGQKLVYYADPDYSIRKQVLSQEQLESLQAAFQALSQFQGLAEFELLDELLPKLEQEFSLKGSQSKHISFEENTFLKGLNHLKPLLQAVSEKVQLKIDYEPFIGKSKTFDVSPYHLKRFNQRWFLFGKTPNHTGLTNLALDRISDIKNSNSPFVHNTSIDFDDYFDDIIGVTRPKGAIIQEVELVFSAKQAPYVLTKPLHPSQRSKLHKDSSLTVKINIIPNYELESLILGFGEKVQVVKPEILRQKIRDRLRMTSYSYSNT